MPTDPGSWVKTILDFIKSKTSIKPLIAIFILTGTAVFLHRWMKIIGMMIWVDRFWPWLVVCCAFSGLILIISAGEHFGGPIVRRRRAKKRIDIYFKTLLTIEDISILQRYSESGRKTVKFHPANGAVQNLVNAGILYWSGNMYSRLHGQDVTVMPLAWPHVKRENFQKHLDRLTAQQKKDRQASIDDRSNQKP
jgi:hypothetical protein